MVFPGTRPARLTISRRQNARFPSKKRLELSLLLTSGATVNPQEAERHGRREDSTSLQEVARKEDPAGSGQQAGCSNADLLALGVRGMRTVKGISKTTAADGHQALVPCPSTQLRHYCMYDNREMSGSAVVMGCTCWNYRCNFGHLALSFIRSCL